MIDIRLSRALAATVVVALPLLAACGGSSTPAGSAAPAASSAGSASAAAPSSSAASATPSTKPSDATDDVKGATKTFIGQVFTVNYSESQADYGKRVEPLVTPTLYSTLKKEVDIDSAVKTASVKFGKDARAKSSVVGGVGVEKLSATEATTKVKFVVEIQQPEGSGWKTLKESADDTATLQLVKQDDAWLVDQVK